MDICSQIDNMKSPVARKLAKICVFYSACCVMVIFEFVMAVKSGLIGFGEGFSKLYKKQSAYTPDVFNGKLKKVVLNNMLQED
ncbi:hypothetical protein [Photobacterium damselae]|uniref:hypothetical protein n=1 Tax=Photobacterium damselae TaxID=38293 RepID=UPI0040698032